MKKLLLNFLIITSLCLFLNSCKSTTTKHKKPKHERKDSTDDVRDDQMDEYYDEMMQLNNQH